MADCAAIRSHPDVAQPAGGLAEWLEGPGGQRTRAAYFPTDNAIGAVVVSTGRTEFIEKYYEVIGELLDRGFAVLVHDWRGQGLSARLLDHPLKGHAIRFDDLVADFRELLDRYDDRLPRPWISLSHSMGGCLVLEALARGERRFSGAVMTAPMLGLKPQRNPALRAVVWLMTAIGFGGRYALGAAGDDPYTATFETDRLTHDRARWERTHAFVLEHRDLALGGVTWGWVESAFRAMSWLRTAPGVADVNIPITMIGAEHENLVDNAGQAAIAARLPDCRYLVAAGAFHEIMMETDDIREVFWRAFDDLAARVISPSG